MNRPETEQLTTLLTNIFELEDTGVTAREAIEFLKEGISSMRLESKLENNLNN